MQGNISCATGAAVLAVQLIPALDADKGLTVTRSVSLLRGTDLRPYGNSGRPLY